MTTYQYEVELLERQKSATAGMGYPLKFRVKTLGGKPSQTEDPPPVRVTLFDSPDRRRQQHWLFPDAKGVYQAVVPLPRPGQYQVFFETGSKRWAIIKVPMLVIDAAAN
ncbi:MAG: hypothetical protein U0Q16_12760 [Bryobacteraceae bacterium]